jgi:CRP-like cAMP-binding protein
MASTDGRDRKLFDILAGETLGIVETFDGGRTVARITVTSAKARVILFPRGIVISLMAEDVGLARALMMICAQRARLLAERFTDLSVQPAIARVAAAILPFASPAVGLTPSLGPLRYMTQAQLALTAGTAKEVAARAIAELEAAGALQRARGRIARTDRSKLDAFARGR